MKNKVMYLVVPFTLMFAMSLAMGETPDEEYSMPPEKRLYFKEIELSMAKNALETCQKTIDKLTKEKTAERSFNKTVEHCTGHVNKRFPSLKLFDAYVDKPGNVRMFGSKENIFKFEKCMVQEGHPLADAK